MVRATVYSGCHLTYVALLVFPSLEDIKADIMINMWVTLHYPAINENFCRSGVRTENSYIPLFAPRRLDHSAIHLHVCAYECHSFLLDLARHLQYHFSSPFVKKIPKEHKLHSVFAYLFVCLISPPHIALSVFPFFSPSYSYLLILRPPSFFGSLKDSLFSYRLHPCQPSCFFLLAFPPPFLLNCPSSGLHTSMPSSHRAFLYAPLHAYLLSFLLSCLPLCFPFYLSASPHPLPVCKPPCFSVFFFACVPASLLTLLSGSSSLPACLHAHFPASVTASCLLCLPDCIPAWFPACLPPDLFTSYV